MDTSQKSLRKATNKDLPKVLELYKKGLEELGITNHKESYLVDKVISSWNLAPCFILEKNDIVGMAGLTMGTECWSGNATLCDYMFYVEPEHRTLSNLGGLVRECKQFADDIGLPLRINLTINNDEKLRERLLKMYGFKPIQIAGLYETT